VFLELIEDLKSAGAAATISFDLSHVGSLVDRSLARANAMRMAEVAAGVGSHLMISAEGSDRTDLVLDLFEQVSDAFPTTGITLQARLHRTPDDLSRVVQRPGPVRLVKGAFLEPASIALPRESEELKSVYLELAHRLITEDHRVNLATHDASLVQMLKDRFGETLHGEHVEFEMLQGLGTKLIDSLRAEGYTTREYIVFGPEWWLYVLNRIAEDPRRIFAALADLG
jgi:proline dehydrogenase